MVSKATKNIRKKRKVTVRVKGFKSNNNILCSIDIGGVGRRASDCHSKKLDELVATLDPGGVGIRLKKEKVKRGRIRRAKTQYARAKAARKARHRH